MTPIQKYDLEYLKKQANTLWTQIVILAEKYWEVYDNLIDFESDFPEPPQDELPF